MSAELPSTEQIFTETSRLVPLVESWKAVQVGFWVCGWNPKLTLTFGNAAFFFGISFLTTEVLKAVYRSFVPQDRSELSEKHKQSTCQITKW